MLWLLIDLPLTAGLTTNQAQAWGEYHYGCNLFMSTSVSAPAWHVGALRHIVYCVSWGGGVDKLPGQRRADI